MQTNFLINISTSRPNFQVILTVCTALKKMKYLTKIALLSCVCQKCLPEHYAILKKGFHGYMINRFPNQYSEVGFIRTAKRYTSKTVLIYLSINQKICMVIIETTFIITANYNKRQRYQCLLATIQNCKLCLALPGISSNIRKCKVSTARY